MFVSAKLPRIGREEISKVKGQGLNTFLIKGENVVYQIDTAGLPKEFPLARTKKANIAGFGRLNNGTIAFDPNGKEYVVKIDSAFYTVKLPDKVKACSNKVVSKDFGHVKLSDQMIVIGPENSGIHRYRLER